MTSLKLIDFSDVRGMRRATKRNQNSFWSSYGVSQSGGSRYESGREIQVVHTPGHSPGHCCFYEPERNYLYSGDLIYKGSLDAFYPTTDPKLFYQSIRRIRKYNIKKVLPGHHQLDIPVSLIADIEAGFAQLERAGKLKQGNGLFKFQDFQIHI